MNNEAALPEESLLLPARIVLEDGGELGFDNDHLDREEFYPGNVLTFRDEEGRHHFLITSVEGDPAELVRVAPARSNLGKGLLLLAILGAAWFAVRGVLALLF